MSKTETIKTLGDALPEEMARVRKLKSAYEAIEGGAGLIAASMMEAALAQADKATAHQDVIGMMLAYEDLKGFTG